MIERSHAIPCPVCLGIILMRQRLAASHQLEVDGCRRCGGLWLDHGEVQGLRGLDSSSVQVAMHNLSAPTSAHCHQCHVPIDRDAESCSACGVTNRLQCPVCSTDMEVVMRDGLRLDVCRGCKGTWFDHHEIAALWGPRFDAALRQRGLPAGSDISGTYLAGDVLFHTALFAPELLHHSASAAVAVAAQLPETIARAPEVSVVVIEAVTDTAGSVFETVVEFVSGVFG